MAAALRQFVVSRADAGNIPTLGMAPIPGNLITVWIFGRGDAPGTPAGFTLHPGGVVREQAGGWAGQVLYRAAQAGDTGAYNLNASFPVVKNRCVLCEWSGVATVPEDAEVGPGVNGAAVPGGGAVTAGVFASTGGLVFGGYLVRTDDVPPSFAPDAGVTELDEGSCDGVTATFAPGGCTVYRLPAVPGNFTIGSVFGTAGKRYAGAGLAFAGIAPAGRGVTPRYW